jgi:hypothetical protein
MEGHLITPKDPSQAFLETVDLSTHKDWFFRVQIRNTSLAPPSGSGYAWISLVKIKPGMVTDWMAVWNRACPAFS